MRGDFGQAEGRILLVATGLAMLIAAPAPAEARVKAPAVVVMTVRYDDLDLASATGRETLRARVSQTADRLCLSPGIRSDDQMRADAECKKALVQTAEAQVASAARPATGDEARELTLARGR